MCGDWRYAVVTVYSVYVRAMMVRSHRWDAAIPAAIPIKEINVRPPRMSWSRRRRTAANPSMSASRGRRIAATALLACAALALGPTTALAAEGKERHPHDEATVPAGLESYYGQALEWYPCTAGDGIAAEKGTGLLCATALVPLDYDDPEGESIEIAMKKHPATDKDKRQGALFFNPGGPGFSGIDGFIPAVAQGAVVSTEVAQAYDIIGFDPRGVGSSTPIQCGPKGQDDPSGSTGSTDGTGSAQGSDSVNPSLDPGAAKDQAAQPQSPEEYLKAVVGQGAQLREQCEKHTRPVGLLDNVDAESVARDMDIMRALVGEHDLDFLGISYGTYLGAAYAELFPENTGRLVLDSAMDPTVTHARFRKEQSEAMNAALAAYLESCVATEGCPFTGTGEEAGQQFADFIKQANETPIPTDDPNRAVTGDEIQSFVVRSLYYPSVVWPQVTEVLAQAKNANNATAVAKALEAAGPVTVSEAGIAIHCMDRPVEGDMTSWAADPQANEMDALCQGWGHTRQEPALEIDGKSAAPIVVVGITGDPATPYHWSEAMANELDSAELVTVESSGHGAYANLLHGNAGICVDKAVDTYLLTGEMPSDDLVCTL